jgi:hypothetical protein
MFDKMNDILRHCGVTIGSLRKIFIILPEDVEVDGIPSYVIPITTEPELYAGKKQYKAQADRNTAFFSEKKNIAHRAGDFYETQVGFQVKHLRYEIDFVCECLKNRRVNILCEDNNRVVRYFKNLRENEEATTGDKWSAKNGYTFNFATRQKNKSQTIPGVTLQGLVGNFTLTGGGNQPSGISATAQFELYDTNTGVKKVLSTFSDGRISIEIL